MRLHRAIVGPAALIAATPVAAEQRPAFDLPFPPVASKPQPNRPDFQISIVTDRFEEGGRILRSDGLIGSVPISSGLQIGVGRYRVTDPDRPRRAPAAHETQPREKGVFAVGMKMRF